MSPKDGDRMENSVDPDQAARSSLILVYTFAQAYLSENLG